MVYGIGGNFGVSGNASSITCGAGEPFQGSNPTLTAREQMTYADCLGIAGALRSFSISV
jgi:hypothetical protein